MGLQLTYVKPDTNTSLSNAYWKIGEVVFQKNTFCTLRVFIFNSKTNSDAGFKPESRKEYHVLASDAAWANFFVISELNEVNQNLIERGYEYLKTLPEFASATDLE